ncbi:unnamed protein product, partial [Callosobruchus maculatus]
RTLLKNLYTAGSTEEEIISDIEKNYKIKPERAIIYKSENSILLIFNNDCEWEVIRSIDRILSQKVRNERYKISRKTVTQCKNCWGFGHVQAHCGMPTVSETTEKILNGQKKLVCTNCGDTGHTARNAQCEFFQWEIQKATERRDGNRLGHQQHQGCTPIINQLKMRRKRKEYGLGTRTQKVQQTKHCTRKAKD